MTEQTKAQRLADILQHKIPSIECLEVSAAELRRLDALNAELVEALEEIAEWTERYTTPGHPISTVARRVIDKAKEQTCKHKYERDEDAPQHLCCQICGAVKKEQI